VKFFRGGLCFLVAFGVAAHGGVESWAASFFEVGAAVLLAAWVVYCLRTELDKLEIPPLLPPLFLFAGVVLFQLVFRRTVNPYETRISLQLLVADLIVLFLAGQSYRKLPDYRGFVWFVMTLGFVVSVFGILQHLTFNGKLYWFREMTYGGIPFGPYVNRNHFAGLMELVIPVGLTPLAFGKVRRERWLLVGLFTLLPVVALLLSASRGGIVSFAVEMVFLGLLVAFRRSSTKHALGGALVLLLALFFVSWLGVGKALERFASLQPLEVTSSKRAAMARDTWRIFLDHPLVGTGFGTLQTVFPKYETLYDGKVVNHTHNDFLEGLAETGVLGAIACAWFLFTLAWRGLHGLQKPENAATAALQAGGLVGCAGFLVHSLVDFNLHIPANALLFFLLASLATAAISTPGTRVRSATP
jgi:O-antigen ligase